MSRKNSKICRLMESFGISLKNRNSRRTTEKPFRASEDQTEKGFVENSPSLEGLLANFRKQFSGYFSANKKRRKESQQMRVLLDICIEEEAKHSTQMEQKIRDLENRNEILEEHNQKLRTEMGKERQEHKKAHLDKVKVIEDLNDQVIRLKEEIHNRNLESEEDISEIENQKNHIYHLNEALQSAEQEIRRQNDDNNQLRNKLQSQEEEIDSLNQEIESNSQEMVSDSEAIQEYQLVIKEQNQEITKLEDQMVFIDEKMVNEKRKFKAIIQRYKDGSSMLQNELNSSQKLISELECQNEKLKVKLNIVREKMASERQKHQAQLKEKDTYAEQLVTQLLETQKLSAAINLNYRKPYLDAQNKF